MRQTCSMNKPLNFDLFNLRDLFLHISSLHARFNYVGKSTKQHASLLKDRNTNL